MKLDDFWLIIDDVNQASGGDMDRKCALLKDRLLRLQSQDLIDFINHFHVADANAYTWSLWGAAYVMHGGCSDDAFCDFRATLISQGRSVYTRALRDSESLAEIEFGSNEDVCYEGFQYVMDEVAEEKLGDLSERSIPLLGDPAGSQWKEDDVNRLYPKLSLKYRPNKGIGSPLIRSRPWWKVW